MFFLSGVARYLFVPLAEAVVLAMIASYILSRTLVPTLASYLLKPKAHGAKSRNPLVWFQRAFERGFERLAAQLSTIAHDAGAPQIRVCSNLSGVVCSCFPSSAMAGPRLLSEHR